MNLIWFDHRSYTVIQAWTGLCNTGAVLWSLCEFVIYPSKVKDANEYMKDHIYNEIYLHIHNLH